MELTQIATTQVERLFDYGIAISVLLLVVIAGGFLVRTLLNRCDNRFQESLDMHRSLTNDVKDVVVKNTTAFYDLREQIRTSGK